MSVHWSGLGGRTDRGDPEAAMAGASDAVLPDPDRPLVSGAAWVVAPTSGTTALAHKAVGQPVLPSDGRVQQARMCQRKAYRKRVPLQNRRSLLPSEDPCERFSALRT